MLVIKRAPGDCIAIGDSIGLRVISIRGDRVTMSVAASMGITRKDRSPSEQSMCIGDDVEIVPVGICGQHVRVGISAPRSMYIRRGGTDDEIPSGGQAQTAVMELRGPLESRFGDRESDP